MEQLLKMKKKFEEIAGSWNGDEAGLGEDRAGYSIEGIEHIDRLIEILKELNLE